MRALLDVNVLIALFDAAHVFHERAHAWWAGARHAGWASCAITENGVVRIMSLPSYGPGALLPPAELIDRLVAFASHTDHAYWHGVISLREPDVFHRERLHRSREITDCWLLALAVRHEGRLVTFDQRISTESVESARPEHLLVI